VPGLRASDEDRERIVAHLRTQQAVGRLTVEELEDRSEAAWAAVEVAQLDALIADLPALVRVQPPSGAPVPVARAPRVPGRVSFTVRWSAPTSISTAVAELVKNVVPPLHACGYDLVERTPDRRVFARRRMPAWAIVVAIVTFPIGLLALLARGEDRITVDLVTRGDETLLVAQGVAPLHVRRAFAQLEEVEEPRGGSA
jgi:hypothetical protein